MTVESLFPRLTPLLPGVQKPIQYVGGELNSVSKDWDSVRQVGFPSSSRPGRTRSWLHLLHRPRGRSV
jgi:hypothetical protein